MNEILMIVLTWIKSHVGVIFAGKAGSIVGAILLDGTAKQKVMSFFVGSMMAFTFAVPVSEALYNGNGAFVFSFCIGISGMTLAKILMIYIDKFASSKAGIEKKDGE